MITFLLYKILPLVALVVLVAKIFVQYKGYNNSKQPSTASKTSGTLKDRVNRAWFWASFIIVPVSFGVWGVMAYEVFAKSHTILFPSIVSGFLLLPVALFAGIFYLIVMFIVKFSHKD